MNNLALYGYWAGSRLTEAAATERPEERWALVNTTDLGWVWHIPIAQDCVSVGLVTNRHTVQRGDDLSTIYDDAVRATPGIGELLESATFLGDRPAGGRRRVAVVEDWAYAVDEVCGDGWYLVGDAAVFVDPVLSSGLTLAANGASLVANAITTVAQDGADEASIRTSYGRTLRTLSAAYHRMARVWYGRNLTAESWHWQARRERIQVGQGLAETDAEAFTAVCLGVIASPLDAAVGRSSRDGWGGEFFNWLVTGHLFERAEGSFAGVDGGDEARAAGRRAVNTRWRRIALSGARIGGHIRREAAWHTHRFLDRWKPVDLAHVDDIAVADFGLLDAISPDARTLDAVRNRATTTERASALVQALLQLDMLGYLETSSPVPAAPRWTGSAPLAEIGRFLTNLPRPARVHVDVDLLGRGLWFHVREDGVTRSHHRPSQGDLAEFIGMGLTFDHVPGKVPVAQPR